MVTVVTAVPVAPDPAKVINSESGLFTVRQWPQLDRFFRTQYSFFGEAQFLLHQNSKNNTFNLS
jgi:hypothetical protein